MLKIKLSVESETPVPPSLPMDKYFRKETHISSCFNAIFIIAPEISYHPPWPDYKADNIEIDIHPIHPVIKLLGCQSVTV